MGSAPVFPYRPCSLSSDSRLPASRHDTILQPKRNVQHLETASATAHLTCSYLAPRNGLPRGCESELSVPGKDKARRLDLEVCRQNLLSSATS